MSFEALDKNVVKDKKRLSIWTGLIFCCGEEK